MFYRCKKVREIRIFRINNQVASIPFSYIFCALVQKHFYRPAILIKDVQLKGLGKRKRGKERSNFSVTLKRGFKRYTTKVALSTIIRIKPKRTKSQKKGKVKLTGSDFIKVQTRQKNCQRSMRFSNPAKSCGLPSPLSKDFDEPRDLLRNVWMYLRPSFPGEEPTKFNFSVGTRPLYIILDLVLCKTQRKVGEKKELLKRITQWQ